MTEAELEEIERRALAAGPGAGLRAQCENPRYEPAVTAFITQAREDVLRLVAALRGSEPLPATELDAIEARAEATGPGPWETFIESEGGLGGCNLIWIGGPDEEHADLYLWRGEAFCGDDDFRFVGAARQDVPRLVEAVRRS
jgi:hypothetical protein